MAPTKRIARRSAAKGLTAFSSLIMTLCRPQSLPTNPTSSIHAPARGATRERGEQLVVSAVSIHAPARSATIAVSRSVTAICVSIHAPARGATVFRFILRRIRTNNHATFWVHMATMSQNDNKRAPMPPFHCANPPIASHHWRFAQTSNVLDEQYALWIVYCLRAKALNSRLPILPEIIEEEAVRPLIDYFTELML